MVATGDTGWFVLGSLVVRSGPSGISSGLKRRVVELTHGPVEPVGGLSGWEADGPCFIGLSTRNRRCNIESSGWLVGPIVDSRSWTGCCANRFRRKGAKQTFSRVQLSQVGMKQPSCEAISDGGIMDGPTLTPPQDVDRGCCPRSALIPNPLTRCCTLAIQLHHLSSYSTCKPVEPVDSGSGRTGLMVQQLVRLGILRLESAGSQTGRIRSDACSTLLAGSLVRFNKPFHPLLVLDSTWHLVSCSTGPIAHGWE